MEENLLKTIGELGLEIEKVSEKSIKAKDTQGNTITIRVSNVKPKAKEGKIVVISPFLAKKINKEVLEWVIKNYDKPVFLNKNSLEKIYPSNLIKVVNYLKENPNSYISKISKELNLHPEKVRRILLKLKDYVEIRAFSEESLPKLPKLIFLKQEIPLEKLKEIAKEKIKIISSERKRSRRIRYENIDKEEALPLILDFIEKNPGTHLREISRKLKINPFIVHACLKEVKEFLEFSSPIGSEDLELPNLPLSIRIKEGYNAYGILRYLRFKKMLRS